MQKPPNPQFLSIVELASLDEKKQMFSILAAEIAMCEAIAQRPISQQLSDHNTAAEADNSPSDAPDSLSSLVEHVPDLGIGKTLEDGILDELTSLRLTASKSQKVQTQWLSPTSDTYKYGGVCNNPRPISGFPNICKLMGIVNSHSSTTGDSDSCLVSCFTSSKKTLSLHKDNEALMAQSSSISTVSFGAPRKLQFVRDGKVKGNGLKDLSADIVLDATHLTMNIMKPGAQKIMKHRVPAGQHLPKKSNLRFSLSFRKIVTEPLSPDNTADQTSAAAVSPPKQQSVSPKSPAVLVAGDSFAARLDADRLGKGKKKVIKVARGGLKIADVQRSIEEFVDGNTKYDIEKVIVSVGTNDIRHCRSGVKHLKNTLCDFMRYLKVTFPSASIYFQSIIPLAHNKCPYVTSNVLDMNNLIFNLCSKFHLYYLDVVGSFLNRWGYRNDRLFPEFDSDRQSYDIHPNKRGLGVLAKHYIYLIHSRWFNPLGY
jgi:hypothetical protein